VVKKGGSQLIEELLLKIPYSTFFILFLAFVLAFITSYLQRKFVNIEEVKKFRSQMDELRKQMFEARKKGDKKALAKLQKKQTQLMRDSSKVMGQQTKISLITMFPFLILFWILYGFFGNTPVAFSPVPIPYGTVGGVGLTFWLWYFLAAMAINLPVTRALKTQPY